MPSFSRGASALGRRGLRLAVIGCLAFAVPLLQLAAVTPAVANTICYGYSPLDYNHFFYECERQANDMTAPSVSWTPVGVVATGRVLTAAAAASAAGIGTADHPTAGAGATSPTAGAGGTSDGGFQVLTPNLGADTAVNANLTTDGGGYTNGGCVGNGACNNLELYWNDTAYLNNSSEGPHLHGAAIMSLLDPVSSSDPNNYYDFADTLANISSDGDYMCALENVQQASDSRSSPIALWPTGTTGVGEQTTQNVSVGISVDGRSAGYSASFNSSAGYISGDIQGPQNGNGATFRGAWYINSNTSGCTNQPTAIEAGSAWQTPTSVGDYNYYFNFGTAIYYSN